MGILNKTIPIVQTGSVYGALNNPEIFVTYTGSDTSTAKTVVDNSTKTIKVTAMAYTITLTQSPQEITAEQFKILEESNATKIALVGTFAGKEVNVICSAADNRLTTDLVLKYYGPEDASGYAYVVKVTKQPTAGTNTHTCTVEQELIGLMKEDFVTTVTVGGVAAGTSITKGTNVAELLQTILKGSQPTGDWKFKYVESETVITGAPATWDTESALPATVKTTGYTFNELAKFNRGYFAFAFNKDLGQLKCIYQNNLHINILGLFNILEIVINNIPYYMYVIAETARLSTTTSFKIMWTLDEE